MNTWASGFFFQNINLLINILNLYFIILMRLIKPLSYLSMTILIRVTITITNKANTVTAKGKVRLTAGCAKNSDHMPCGTVCSGVSIPAGNAVWFIVVSAMGFS